MTIPTDTDWRTPTRDDLDAAYARRMFLGKSAKDTLPMFRENVLERVEDLRFMPPVPFRYYVLSFRTFVLSDAALEDELVSADAASCFLDLVESKLKEDPSSILPVIWDLLPAVESVATQQERYAAPVSIYGDFLERARRIKALLKAA